MHTRKGIGKKEYIEFKTVDISRNMTKYKNGFGQLNGSFWLGLDKIHQLTTLDRGAILRVDLKHKDYPGKI